MRAARLVLLAVAVLGATLISSASASQSGLPSVPRGLHGFELRPNEAPKRTFARTPAFAWSPVRGAACYEFELATSSSFAGNSVIWSNVASGATAGRHCRPVKVSFTKAPEPGTPVSEAVPEKKVTYTIAPIRIPAVSVNLTLPWINGKLGYALYAHVRSVTTQGASPWSSPFGFDMRWESTPIPMTARPGLVRWSTIDGATGYEPAVSYGPWTSVHATTNPTWSSGKIRLDAAISDEVSTGVAPPHELMPAVTWTGDQSLDGHSLRLFRVYAFTGHDCVNVVLRARSSGAPPSLRA